MVETHVRSDQRTDAIGVSDGFRARNWTRAVACMAEIAAVAIRVWSPGRDGPQLRPVRRMLSRR